MAFYAPGGPPEPGDDPDPVRRTDRQFVEHLDFLLEAGEQMHDANAEEHAEYERRIEALERSVATPRSTDHGRFPMTMPDGDKDAAKARRPAAELDGQDITRAERAVDAMHEPLFSLGGAL